MNAFLNELSQPIPGTGLIIFFGLLSYAAVSDLLTMRIPNWLNAAIATTWLVYALLLPLDWTEIGYRVVWALGVFMVAACMFYRGWMGGGDVKMIPAVMLWIPHAHYYELLAVVSMFGGMLAISVLMLRAFAMPVFTVGWVWLERIHSMQKKIPYGIAIALGGMTIKYMEVAGELLT
jgi:prepilin peptidase CpaA